jgi:alpha-tubulin suppressor-like RCC1 family protein
MLPNHEELLGGIAVYSWGWNSEGQLGLGHTRSMRCPTLVEAPVLEDEDVVKVGALASLAITCLYSQ